VEFEASSQTVANFTKAHIRNLLTDVRDSPLKNIKVKLEEKTFL
jgi:hypothetical protein